MNPLQPSAIFLFKKMNMKNWNLCFLMTATKARNWTFKEWIIESWSRTYWSSLDATASITKLASINIWTRDEESSKETRFSRKSTYASSWSMRKIEEEEIEFCRCICFNAWKEARITFFFACILINFLDLLISFILNNWLIWTLNLNHIN